jgi:hypothetical protein
MAVTLLQHAHSGRHQTCSSAHTHKHTHSTVAADNQHQRLLYMCTAASHHLVRPAQATQPQCMHASHRHQPGRTLKPSRRRQARCASMSALQYGSSSPCVAMHSSRRRCCVCACGGEARVTCVRAAHCTACRVIVHIAVIHASHTSTPCSCPGCCRARPHPRTSPDTHARTHARTHTLVSGHAQQIFFLGLPASAGGLGCA